jgi:glyoxylase-like metal-dependent hydrolase (beta-lactamase superfamily II)
LYSLIVFGDDATYFLAGDATYCQDLLDQELTDAINDSASLAIESLRKIKEFARQLPLVVLPAHDRRHGG